jgi:hypothetical protein
MSNEGAPFMAKALLRIMPLHECIRQQPADGHLGCNVILCDEPPKWYNDDDDAEDAYYQKVQETKNALTQHQHNGRLNKQKKKEKGGFLQHV